MLSWLIPLPALSQIRFWAVSKCIQGTTSQDDCKTNQNIYLVGIIFPRYINYCQKLWRLLVSIEVSLGVLNDHRCMNWRTTFAAAFGGLCLLLVASCVEQQIHIFELTKTVTSTGIYMRIENRRRIQEQRPKHEHYYSRREQGSIG